MKRSFIVGAYRLSPRDQFEFVKTISRICRTGSRYGARWFLPEPGAIITPEPPEHFHHKRLPLSAKRKRKPRDDS